MISDVLDIVVCPGCRAHPLREHRFGGRDGVLSCVACGRWYPIEDGLLELLVQPLGYAEDRARFRERFARDLRAAGLAVESQPKASVERSAEILHQQEHFDWYADNTVQTYAEYEQLPFWLAVDEITFARWKEQIRPGSRVLDVGCAQGRSTHKVAGRTYDVVAFDISKRLVRQAIDRAVPEDRITFFVADATSLPFRPTTFDHVLTYGVLHHLPDPAAICRQISSVLKPGGVFFASENNRSALRAAFELLQRVRPLWHEEAGEYALISREELSSWLEEAGFSVRLRTSVFLPPHLLNRVPQATGERMLEHTDRLANALPGLRGNGGLVVVEGIKQPVAT